MVLNVFNYANACDCVEFPFELLIWLQNVDVFDRPMPVYHSLRPVVANIVDGRYDETAIPQQMWPCGCARTNIQNFGRPKSLKELLMQIDTLSIARCEREISGTVNRICRFGGHTIVRHDSQIPSVHSCSIIDA